MICNYNPSELGSPQRPRRRNPSLTFQCASSSTENNSSVASSNIVSNWQQWQGNATYQRGLSLRRWSWKG